MKNKDLNLLQEAYSKVIKEEKDDLRGLYEPSEREKAESVYGEEPPSLEDEETEKEEKKDSKEKEPSLEEAYSKIYLKEEDMDMGSEASTDDFENETPEDLYNDSEESSSEEVTSETPASEELTSESKENCPCGENSEENCTCDKKLSDLEKLNSDIEKLKSMLEK
jgi:hypothetical protein